MSRDSWLLERSRSIGGSDSPIILNGRIPIEFDHKFGSLHKVWASKAPVREKYDLPEPSDALHPIKDRRMIQGHKSEPICREYIGQVNGATATECFEELYRRKDFPMLHGSIDGEMNIDGEVVGIEIKTLGTRAEWWSDGVPFRVELQSRHNWFCRPSLNRFIVCAFKTDDSIWDAIIRGAMTIEDGISTGMVKFGQWELEKNDFYEEVCVPELVGFWKNYVATGKVPMADSTEECKKVLESLYTENDGVIDADEELSNLIERKLELDVEFKSIKKERDRVRNEMMRLIGSNNRANSQYGSVSISRVFSKRFNEDLFFEDNPDLKDKYVKESSYCRVSISKKREG